MKFSKPGETENVESGGSDSDTADTMPVVESELCGKFEFKPKPADEMVAAHGEFIAQNFDRVGELEDRVEELERQNEELEEALNGLIETLNRANVIEVK